VVSISLKPRLKSMNSAVASTLQKQLCSDTPKVRPKLIVSAAVLASPKVYLNLIVSAVVHWDLPLENWETHVG
jgi:hypothetical protein